MANRAGRNVVEATLLLLPDAYSHLLGQLGTLNGGIILESAVPSQSTGPVERLFPEEKGPFPDLQALSDEANLLLTSFLALPDLSAGHFGVFRGKSWNLFWGWVSWAGIFFRGVVES